MVGKVLKKVSRNTKITQEILSFITKSVMDNANGPWPTFCRNQNVFGGTEPKKNGTQIFFGTHDFKRIS